MFLFSTRQTNGKYSPGPIGYRGIFRASYIATFTGTIQRFPTDVSGVLVMLVSLAES